MDHDIIIVGAGPAGLSTGLHLVKLAPELAQRTLILERERRPRPRLCAGGIMPGGEACLRRLGFDLSDVPSVDVREAHFLFERRGFVVRRQPSIFRIVRRAEFDAWLADRARAQGLVLHEDTPVRRVRRLADVVQVETDRATYRAHAVVGADGAASVVRRAVAREHVPHVSCLLEILVPHDGQSPLSPGLGEGRRFSTSPGWPMACRATPGASSPRCGEGRCAPTVFSIVGSRPRHLPPLSQPRCGGR